MSFVTTVIAQLFVKLSHISSQVIPSPNQTKCLTAACTAPRQVSQPPWLAIVPQIGLAIYTAFLPAATVTEMVNSPIKNTFPELELNLELCTS